jgi:hypothetical protein
MERGVGVALAILACMLATALVIPRIVTRADQSAASTDSDDLTGLLLGERKGPKVGYFAKPAPISMDSPVGLYYGPEPEKRPSSAPGQQFLIFPSDVGSAGEKTEFVDSRTSEHLTWRELLSRTLKLQKVESWRGGQWRYTFLVEKRTDTVYLDSGEGVSRLPHLVPIVTDAVVRALKAKYEGKRVWRYPGAGGTAILDTAGPSIRLWDNIAVPFLITHVERVYTTSHLSLHTDWGNEGYASVCPLVIFLDAQPGRKGRSLDWKQITPHPPGNSHARCLAFYNILSDSWDLERAYSLVGPLDPSRKWSTRTQKSILDGDTSKGMTREMVAWAIGWPSSTATRSELLKLDHWLYYAPPPYSMDLYFSSGRLVRQAGPYSQP